MTFKSGHELQDAITKYEVKYGYGIMFKKCDRDRLRIVYKFGCKWVVHTSMESHINSLAIKTHYLKRRCSKEF